MEILYGGGVRGREEEVRKQFCYIVMKGVYDRGLGLGGLMGKMEKAFVKGLEEEEERRRKSGRVD